MTAMTAANRGAIREKKEGEYGNVDKKIVGTVDLPAAGLPGCLRLFEGGG
jgi:hypothetical protein